MNHKIKLVIVIITMFSTSIPLRSQLNPNNISKNINSAIYEWFDKEIGLENTAIYNGFLDDGDGYFEKNKSFRDTQRYFKQFSFLSGNLIYDNQLFNNIKIKYDVYEDELLLNLESSKKNLTTIRPIKAKVKEFVIDNHLFINLDNLNTKSTSLKGYVEVLYMSSYFSLYKKYTKQRLEKRVDGKLLYHFTDKSHNFLLYKGELVIVKKAKNLNKIFPEYKSEIKLYSAKKGNNETNVINILKKIDVIMSNKTNTL